MTDQSGKRLTRREFEAVIGRAAELASSDADNGDGDLSEAELFRIAGEVGLRGIHVRQVLEEVRSDLAFGRPLDRWFGPRFIRADRVVPGNHTELCKRLDDFLVGTQLLQSVRRGSEVLLYRPAVDWASQIVRAASSQSRKNFADDVPRWPVTTRTDPITSETTVCCVTQGVPVRLLPCRDIPCILP